MKEYLSIPKDINRDLLIYAFDKLDGSNIRAEWTRKYGFNKFGSRHCLINETDPFLGESIKLIKELEPQLADIFKKNRWDKVTCFFEYWSENSFAGVHASEPHKVTLIDVCPDKKGILPPREFLDLFEEINIPKCLYIGKVNQTFEDSVRNGLLDGMTFEGVVCKGVRKGRHLTMFKIKNKAWIEKLRSYCGNDEKKFNQLL